MALTITHPLLNRRLPVSEDGLLIAATTFRFKVNRTGHLRIRATAHGTRWVLGGNPDPDEPLHHGHPEPFDTDSFDLTLIDPDGQPFAGRLITLEVLNRYRDARGIVRDWTLHIAEKRYPNPQNEEERYWYAVCHADVIEDVVSSSAGPLIGGFDDLVETEQRTYPFDLYRLGVLSAYVHPLTQADVAPPVLSLIDPNGIVQATSDSGMASYTMLSYMVDFAALARSRGPGGVKRQWQLRVNHVEGSWRGRYEIFAHVHTSSRIPASVLQPRLDTLFGTQGTNLTLKLNNGDLTLAIHDEDVAETLDLFGFLDKAKEDINADSDDPIEVNTEYPLDRVDLHGDETALLFHFHWQAIARNLNTKSIRVNLGESYNPPPPQDWPSGIPLPPGYSFTPGLPAVLIDITTDGKIDVEIEGYDDATVVMPHIRAQMAFVIEDGAPHIRGWIDPFSIRYGPDEGSPVGAGAKVREKIRSRFVEKLENVSIENIPFFYLGGLFTFTGVRWTGDAIEFDYIAGVEPERQPRPGYRPRGIQAQTQPNWDSPNLQHVNHIVVLMMENRSFDHVLGHLSVPLPGPGRTHLPPRNGRVDGLTLDLLAKFHNRSFAEAEFSPKTQFPVSVGHSFEDVKEQLHILRDRTGAETVTMEGFVDNFKRQHKPEKLAENKCKVTDVLGYYPHGMLPIYDFLSSEFMVCDHFFCSHLGPTMPNRMFSLSGDYTVDRFGEPNLNNGFSGGTVQLAREVNIFDVLTRLGVSWRVYESPPSVAMLRFFSRYSGQPYVGPQDNRGLRDIASLKEDLLQGFLPQVTFVDPALHYQGNDDHPTRDMMNGQVLVRKVYEALAANRELFNGTLLIVTYDEHGGFFDHARPPIAEGLPGRWPVDVRYGVRVPGFLVSPYVQPGAVFKEVVDFGSILKTILIKFCANERPFLSDRVTWARDFGPALSLAQPRTAIPHPPPLAHMTPPMPSVHKRVPRSQLVRDGADFHEVLGVIGRAIRRA